MIFHLFKMFFVLLKAKGILTAEEFENIELAMREDDKYGTVPQATTKAIRKITEDAEKEEQQ